MAEVLFELGEVLRSKKHEFTLQESTAIINCKSKALRSYAVGSLFGGGLSLIATSRFSLFGQISISAGTSAFVGLWRLGNSLESCLDHILALEDSKMQRELANLMVAKYRHYPGRMRLISKHFYSEEVFDDSASDQPKIRWRYRNFFSDHISGQRTHEDDSYGDSHSDSHGVNNSNTHSASHVTNTDTRTESDSTKFDSKPKQAPVNVAFDTTDPIDCFFGHQEMEEIHHDDPSTPTPKVRTRKEKRAHRRRRLRHQDVLLSSQPA